MKFELIGGIVYMMAPAGYEHGRGDYKLTGITFQYELATPGVKGAHNTSVILAEESEPQPDIVLLLQRQCGGKAKIRGGKTKYIVGPPELIIEVAHSSRSIDLHKKPPDYRKGGVSEYIVFDIQSQTVHWFDLQTNEQLAVPSDEIVRSRTFPGYWIDVRALLAENPHRLAKCMSQGIAAPEHQEFVAELARRRREHKKSVRARKSPKSPRGPERRE